MYSLEQLEAKWQALASEITASVRGNLEGDMYHVVIATAQESIERLKVGTQELRRTSHVLFLTGYSSFGGCETSLAGWLCFPSELEMLLYIKFVWLALIQKELIGSEDRETFALLERAVEISIRERGEQREAIACGAWKPPYPKKKTGIVPCFRNGGTRPPEPTLENLPFAQDVQPIILSNNPRFVK